MLVAAELDALAPVRARSIGLHDAMRGVARNHIPLSLQIRNPEAVDHVGGLQFEIDWAADGNMNLVSCRQKIARRRIVVSKVPPPLVAGDADFHSLFRRWVSNRSADNMVADE